MWAPRDESYSKGRLRLGEEMVRGRTALVDLIVGWENEQGSTGRRSDNREGQTPKKETGGCVALRRGLWLKQRRTGRRDAGSVRWAFAG